MSDTLITYELDGNVALIGLNRPDKRNSINDPLIDELRAAVLRAHEEADVAVLFGHGTNFCAGLDLADLREYQPHDDVRHIDWNVTARLATPHVRVYTEDRDITSSCMVAMAAVPTSFILSLASKQSFDSGRAESGTHTAPVIFLHLWNVTS